jgi:hypothetical protein
MRLENLMNGRKNTIEEHSEQKMNDGRFENTKRR